LPAFTFGLAEFNENEAAGFFACTGAALEAAGAAEAACSTGAFFSSEAGCGAAL
jgi:hypothetical protein